MPRPDEEAGGVRDDEANEADRTHHADDACRHRRRHAEQHDLDAAYGNAERGGSIRAESEGVQRPHMGHADDEA